MTIDEMCDWLVNIDVFSDGHKEAIATKLRTMQDHIEALLKLSDSQQEDIREMEARLKAADNLLHEAKETMSAGHGSAMLHISINEYEDATKGG